MVRRPGVSPAFLVTKELHVSALVEFVEDMTRECVFSSVVNGDDAVGSGGIVDHGLKARAHDLATVVHGHHHRDPRSDCRDLVTQGVRIDVAITFERKRLSHGAVPALGPPGACLSS